MADAPKKKTCFVMMPISDVEGYEAGHFKRVYDHIIKPACEASNLDTLRADDVAQTNFIVGDILQRILASDLVICDLSSRNPNVMYELGIRHAFDKPVVLLQDTRTVRIFDVQGLRTLDYSDQLRIDTVVRDVAALTRTIGATMDAGSEEVNSMIRLVSLPKASTPQTSHLSNETALVLNALKDLSGRITKLENSTPVYQPLGRQSNLGLGQLPLPSKGLLDISNPLETFALPSGHIISPGTALFDRNGMRIGTFKGITSSQEFLVEGVFGMEAIGPNDSRWPGITPLPPSN